MKIVFLILPPPLPQTDKMSKKSERFFNNNKKTQTQYELFF